VLILIFLDSAVHFLSHTIYVPLTSSTSVNSDLKFPIDCCYGAAAATHSLCDFAKSHVAIT